jgi:glycosyltransferase 2 family protein
VSDAFRRRGGLALRVLVSVALLGAVLVYADPSEVAAAVRDGHWGWFAAALAVMAVAVVVGALRWWLLLEGADIHVPAWRAVRPFAMSLALNLLLPTAIAGDVVRTWVMGKDRGRLLGAAAATLVDKATALTCLYLVGWAAYAIDRNAVPHQLVVVFAWVTAGLIAVGVIAALAAAGVRPILHRLPERFAAMARESWRMLKLWAGSARLVASLVGLGLAYQVLAVLALILVGKTLGVDLPFALAAVCGAIVVVATLIPVSVGGAGIREGGFVLLLGEAGINAADATLISLLGAVVVLLASVTVAAAAYLHDLLAARQKSAGQVPGRRSA